jgi:putative ABC transport system permease protein
MSQEIRTVSQIASGNQNWYTQILGESQDYFDLRQWPFAEGTSFTDQDVRSASKVCVVGKTVAQQLFGNESPIGQIVRVKNVPFVILGMLIPKGLSVQGTDQDDVIIMPYSSAMKRVLGATTLRGINVQAADAATLPEAQKQITEILRQRHHIQPGRDDDFTVRNQQEIADASNAASETMRVLLGAIAGVSLVVGGIGIMNIMLVSVTERTREIGIRMAVGGRGRDILLQFLIEAITLSTFGGAIGIGVGLGTSKILSVVKGWATLTTPGSILVAFLFSAAVGIFFGFYPARKASRLDPIDALHYE